MSLEKFLLDINYVRSQFPTFKDKLNKKYVFFENAGGSFVPNTVIDHLKTFMTSTKVQPYAEYSMSKIAGEQMDKAINLFAKMINAKSNEIIIGGSTTINIYVLAQALKKMIKPGDEIIVTNQDHEANIGAWRRLKECGAKIKEWKMNKKNSELEIEDLEKLLNSKTKIVAVTHCSNIVGSINDIKKISKIVHKYGALIFADGVSYAPHGFPNVKDLDVDFYAFSLYKTYGPHLGLLYGKNKILKKLPNQNHHFLKNQIPYTLNPGGPNHEELSSLIGIYEYFENLYNHHYGGKKLPIHKKIKKVNELISNHESKIGNLLLKYLDNKKNITVIGKKRIRNKDRAPTISFIHKKISSKILSQRLVKNGIATRNDNFYAWRCLDFHKISTEDGVVRISMVHYNTLKEVHKLIKILDKIL